MEALAKTCDALIGYEEEDSEAEWISESIDKPEPAIAAKVSNFDALGQASELTKLLRASPDVRLSVLHTRVMGRFKFTGGVVSGQANGSSINLFEATSPGDKKDLLKNEISYLRRKSQERGDRLQEIFVQVDDLASFYESILHIRQAPLPRVYDLIDLVLALSHSVSLQVKHALGCPRPSEISRQIMPMLEVPGHSSFPSGHATAAYALSELLTRLLNLAPNGSLATRLRRLAFRIAQNREVAGLHFSVDSAAGQLLGTALAGYVSELALASQKGFYGFKFLAGSMSEDMLKTLRTERALQKETADLNSIANITVTKSTFNSKEDKLLAEIWEGARAELTAFHP